MTTINDKLSKASSYEPVGGYQYVEGPKFNMPTSQISQANKSDQISFANMSPAEAQKFEKGLEKLGLLDLVRHLKYPVV